MTATGTILPPHRPASAVALAPGVERLQDRSERLALVGQEILVARRMAFIKSRADHAGALDESWRMSAFGGKPDITEVGEP